MVHLINLKNMALMLCLFLSFFGLYAFNDVGYGINALLFLSAALIGCYAIFYHFHREKLANTENTTFHLLSAFSIFFSIGIAWHDSEVTTFFNVLGLWIAACLAFTIKFRGNHHLMKAFDFIRSPINLLIKPIAGTSKLLQFNSDESGQVALTSTTKQQSRSLLLGLIWSLPIIYLFSNLLISSDVRFEGFMSNLFDFKFSNLPENIFRFSGYWLLSAGFIHCCFWTSKNNKEEKQSSFGIDALQILPAIFLLNILFISYIAIQSSYFFGGDKLILGDSGVTYSSYARKGFWDLLWVAFLALPFLYFANWLLRFESEQKKRLFTLMAATMLGLILILEASAAHRMMIYVQAYNFTLHRLFSSWFMLFIVVALVLFTYHVLYKQNKNFLYAVCITALCFISGLNIINPDRFVASYNLEWNTDNKLPDLYYISRLSIDAYPVVIKHYDSFDPQSEDTQHLLTRMERDIKKYKEHGSWKEWSHAKSVALELYNTQSPTAK